MRKRVIFANIVLGSIIILFLLMFFYALLKSNLQPQGHMNKYYIFSITGLLFFTFVLLRCDVELKVKIVLLMLSLIVSIYAIEIVLSYNYKTNRIKQNRANVADYLGIAFDSRAVIQITADLRNKGIDAYPLYNPYSNMDLKETEIFPLGFISGKTTVYCNESGEYIIYKSDEHGFNNPEGLYDEKYLDYILIGDSFIQGACVKRKDNIAGRLTRTGKKVLNLGMLNSGPLNQLAILKEYGKPLKPGFVFWFFYEGNDHEGLAFDKESSFLLKYLAKDFSQDLIHKQKLVDEILIENVDDNLNGFMKARSGIAKENMKAIKEKTEGINKKKEAAAFNISLSNIKLSQLSRRLGLLPECVCEIDPLFKDIFTEAKSIVNAWNGQLYFVYLPSWNRYPGKTNQCRKRFLNTGKNKMLSLIKDLQIPIIDIQSVFDSYPDPLSLFPFRIHGHYNAKGYMLIAEHIEKYLSNNRNNVEEPF